MENFNCIFEILKNRHESKFRVEYYMVDGWTELHKDQPIWILWEYELRIVEE